MQLQRDTFLTLSVVLAPSRKLLNKLNIIWCCVFGFRPMKRYVTLLMVSQYIVTYWILDLISRCSLFSRLFVQARTLFQYLTSIHDSSVSKALSSEQVIVLHPFLSSVFFVSLFTRLPPSHLFPPFLSRQTCVSAAFISLFISFHSFLGLQMSVPGSLACFRPISSSLRHPPPSLPLLSCLPSIRPFPSRARRCP